MVNHDQYDEIVAQHIDADDGSNYSTQQCDKHSDAYNTKPHCFYYWNDGWSDKHHILGS